MRWRSTEVPNLLYMAKDRCCQSLCCSDDQNCCSLQQLLPTAAGNIVLILPDMHMQSYLTGEGTKINSIDARLSEVIIMSMMHTHEEDVFNFKQFSIAFCNLQCFMTAGSTVLCPSRHLQRRWLKLHHN